MIFLDTLISSDPKIKFVLYFMLCEDTVKNDKTGIIKEGKRLCTWGNIQEKISKDRESYKKVLSIIYFLFSELGQFCMFKTFIDEDWKEIWLRYHQLGNFIKNLCENNSVYFKRYLSNFKPKVKTNASFNKSNRNIAFDLYVRVESFTNNYLSWYIDDSRITMADRPELFLCAIRHFEIITEFVNGPCPFNQRLIYRYRTDSWMGMLNRIMDDVDSVFYILKDIILEYIMSLIEGEGYFPLEDDVP
jgi:hypothetical protein